MLKINKVFSVHENVSPGVWAAGSGYVSSRLINHIYAWLRKTTSYPSAYTRFWVSLQTNIPLTRKPTNLRMGKGKGSKKALRAFIHCGTFFFKLTGSSASFMYHLHRKLRARVSFKLGLSLKNGGGERYTTLVAGKPFTWLQSSVIQNGYYKSQFFVIKKMLERAYRPKLLGYWVKVFWWRFIVPHAVWSPSLDEGGVQGEMFRIAQGFKQSKRTRWATFKLLSTPQSTYFVRQLYVNIVNSIALKQGLKRVEWGVVRERWAMSVLSVNVTSAARQLPWDKLLIVQGLKAYFPYINYQVMGSLNLVRGARLTTLPPSLRVCMLAQIGLLGVFYFWQKITHRPLSLVNSL